jgi:hypothetical protein
MVAQANSNLQVICKNNANDLQNKADQLGYGGVEEPV